MVRAYGTKTLADWRWDERERCAENRVRWLPYEPWGYNG